MGSVLHRDLKKNKPCNNIQKHLMTLCTEMTVIELKNAKKRKQNKNSKLFKCYPFQKPEIYTGLRVRQLFKVIDMVCC